MEWIKGLFGSAIGIALVVGGLLPLPVHIWWCIERADETGSAIALLIVGLVFFPVGWLHGISVLFGFGGWV